MSNLQEEMMARKDEAQARHLSRFFKTGLGQYGEGDLFLGIKVPTTREIVKQQWKSTDFDELEECVASPYHEIRLAALLTLIQTFSHAKGIGLASRHCLSNLLSSLLAVLFVDAPQIVLDSFTKLSDTW